MTSPQSAAIFAVETPFAWEVLADKRLYKFRGFATEQQKERLRDIVIGNRVRFSRISELNDPSEGKPTFRLGDWNSLAYRRKLERWALGLNPPHVLSDRRMVRILKKRLSSFTKLDHEQCIQEIVEGNQAQLEARWRILSLSANASSELLWAHYAESHRGVALVFDASADAFGCALKVSYVNQLAPIDITEDEPSLNFRVSLLTKRVAWAYEDEYRWIAADSNDPFTSLNNQLLEFEPKKLLGVILGANLSRADKQQIAGWSRERTAAMTLWQASVEASGSIAISPYAP